MPFLAALVILIVIILLSCINVVPQARAYVIERLGVRLNLSLPNRF